MASHLRYHLTFVFAIFKLSSSTEFAYQCLNIRQRRSGALKVNMKVYNTRHPLWVPVPPLFYPRHGQSLYIWYHRGFGDSRAPRNTHARVYQELLELPTPLSSGPEAAALNRERARYPA